MIYFFRRECDGLTKIGYSKDGDRLQSRRSALISGCPDGRIIYCTRGTEDHEKSIHALLGADRVGGEWFRDSERLRRVIQILQIRDALIVGGYMPESCWLSVAMETALHLVERLKGLSYLKLLAPLCKPESAPVSCPDHPESLLSPTGSGVKTLWTCNTCSRGILV